jgi:hypothetical protein
LDESLERLRRFSRAASGKEDERRVLRQLAQENLYFLCKGILKFAKPFYAEEPSPTFHGPLCAELDSVGLPFARTLDLWPRGHLKTHIITIGKNIQHYLKNHDVRILLVGSNEDNSKKNLGLIKYQFEHNTLLQWIFPECIPDTKGDKWTETAIVLPRPHNRAETTFKAIGWGTRITGWHFDVLNKDDLIDEKTEKSPQVMEKIISWHLLSKNLLESPSTGVDQVVGTRWMQGDLYDYIIKNEPEYHVRRVSALWRDSVGQWQASWPERFTVSALTEMRTKNAYMFACQQMNDPRDESVASFKAGWLKYYGFSDDAQAIICEA